MRRGSRSIPGVPHYLIHTYDMPALAARGVPAAERYAGIAADAPHALHMPSHIFTRVGRWEDSIETNRRSAETARARQAVFDEIHALDYMVYGYLQTGQIEAARRVVAELPRFAAWNAPAPIFAWALTVMPARYALERGAWEEAAALDTGPADGAARRREHPLRPRGRRRARRAPGRRGRRHRGAEGRGRGAARQRRLLGGADGDPAPRRRGLGGLRPRRARSGLALLREAAEREGRTDKHPVTPGPLVPAREQLAEMLLLMGRPAEAQREFEAVQETEPRRFRAVYGAARAAELARRPRRRRGGTTRSCSRSRRALEPGAEVEQARAFLASR